MAGQVVAALIGATGVLLVALIGLLGSRLAARTQRKAEENERRISALEVGNQLLIDNLTKDNESLRQDAKAEHAAAVTAQIGEAVWRKRALDAGWQPAADDPVEGG